jgi:hypothetical protein
VADITVERWEYLVGTGQPVGRCPLCRGPMLGEAPVETAHGLFLDSQCLRCGHEVSAPGGRRLDRATVVQFRRRTVRHVERPADHQERASGERAVSG